MSEDGCLCCLLTKRVTRLRHVIPVISYGPLGKYMTNNTAYSHRHLLSLLYRPHRHVYISRFCKQGWTPRAQFECDKIGLKGVPWRIPQLPRLNYRVWSNWQCDVAIYVGCDSFKEQYPTLTTYVSFFLSFRNGDGEVEEVVTDSSSSYVILI